jgi:ankyrin repeat protein
MKLITTQRVPDFLLKGWASIRTRRRKATCTSAVLSAFLVLSMGCSNPDREYEKAFQSESIPTYQNVLEKYPNHTLAKEANARLGELLWQAAKQKRDMGALRSLIRDYPQAGFAADAASLLDDLSWEAAQSQNTTESYTHYSSGFPSGKYVTQAQAQIEELAWQAAVDSESIDELKKFTTQFQQSTHKSEGEQRIKFLQTRNLKKILESDNVEEFIRLDDGTLDKSIREAFRYPPLLVAADTGSEKIVAYLIKKGADVNERGNDQATALHLAVRSNALGIVKALVENKAKIDASIQPTMRFIHVAEGGRANYHTPPPSAKKGTPLHWAAYYNCPEALVYLIQHGANVSADDGYGNTPVHFAAQSGNMEMINALIKAGADWRTKRKDGDSRPNPTPLHYAKTVDVAEYFLKKGVQIDTDSDLGKPIHAASHFGQTEVIEYLLKRGAKVDSLCFWEVGALNSVQATPLWVAARAGNTDVIDLLASKGGNIRYRVRDGGSLFHAAAMSGQVNVIRSLVQKGLPVDDKADFPDPRPMTKAWQSITPLGVAILYGQLEAVKAFVDAGANVNASFGDKWNPLLVAVVSRNKEIVYYLLQKDANLGEHRNIKTLNTSNDIKEILGKHFD